MKKKSNSSLQVGLQLERSKRISSALQGALANGESSCKVTASGIPIVAEIDLKVGRRIGTFTVKLSQDV